MKKIIIAAMMVLGIVGNAFAYTPDPWAVEDTILQGTFLGVMFVDCWQTYDFLYKDNRIDEDSTYCESNPILGKYPSKQKVFTCWALAAVGHTTISYLLPKPIRNIWQGCWIAIEGDAVHHNYCSGVRVGIGSKF